MANKDQRTDKRRRGRGGSNIRCGICGGWGGEWGLSQNVGPMCYSCWEKYIKDDKYTPMNTTECVKRVKAYGGQLFYDGTDWAEGADATASGEELTANLKQSGCDMSALRYMVKEIEKILDEVRRRIVENGIDPEAKRFTVQRNCKFWIRVDEACQVEWSFYD